MFNYYPYITQALERIHGRLPRGGFCVCDPTSPDVDENWYEEIVYSPTETLEKPTKEKIIEEVLLIKEEKGHI